MQVRAVTKNWSNTEGLAALNDTYGICKWHFKNILKIGHNKTKMSNTQSKVNLCPTMQSIADKSKS